MYKGIVASSGITLGKVFKIEKPELVIKTRPFVLENEIKKLDDGIVKTRDDINSIINNANLSKDELNIFNAHLAMCNDPIYYEEIVNNIKNNMLVEVALDKATTTVINSFNTCSDSCLKERISDINDVARRLLNNILGIKTNDLALINEKTIIVGEDLVPSETAQLNKEYILGFVTEKGGRTSHTSIIARSLDLPAIVGVENIMANVNNGDIILLDAINNCVIVNPSEEEIQKYNLLKKEYEQELSELNKYKEKKAITLDNHQVEVTANITSINDLPSLLSNNVEGIGLYRTEFLYMNDNAFPNEDKQYEIYKKLVIAMNNKKTIIRTMDVGGDKGLPYFEFPKDLNPFLGYRAIRMSLDRQDIFRTQIRAMLRASKYGKLGIMFPMVTTIKEFLDAKAIVLEEKENLIKEGYEISNDIEIGMMVEIPAAALEAEQFSKYADFFSIGTNDLIQYTMAADRTSKQVSYLYQPLNPALLKLIKMTIDGAHANNKWCGLCGEVTEEEDALALLVGMGLDEISVPATSILKTRKIINSINYEDYRKLTQKAITLDSEADVKDIISK